MRIGPKRQRGMTGLGWLTVLFLIGFFAFLALKLVPIYLEHYSIKSVIYSLPNEPEIGKKSPRQVMDLISRRFTINSIYNFDRKAIKIKKAPGIYKVQLQYTVQEPMVGNIDILVKFEEEVDLVKR